MELTDSVQRWFAYFAKIDELSQFSAGNMASIYYEQGQLDMAVVNYRKAITFDSGFLEAYNNLVCLPALSVVLRLITNRFTII